jgi:hypothetical protein
MITQLHKRISDNIDFVNARTIGFKGAFLAFDFSSYNFSCSGSISQ